MASSHFAEVSMAPWVNVPENDITSIEHPCIVKNRFKAIDMLGGAQQIAQSLDQGTKQSLSLTFDPNDSARRKILSLHNNVSNVLLKITVPKRTGRKRKRGSEGPWTEPDLIRSVSNGSAYVVKSLQDNADSSDVEAVGAIKSCHVWRSIPDFVYFTKTSKFLHNIETQLLPQQYPKLKQWSMPRTYGLEDTEVIPPPVFSTQSLSHNYTYRQNPAVKTVADPTTGNKVLHNRAQPLRLHIQNLMFNEPAYPDGPSADCPPLEEQSTSVQDVVKQLKDLFEKRPIWTRRALVNSLPLDSPTQLVKIAAAYVCYSLRSGPWRDAYVKFGIDPRSDPKYRIFQTILLKLMPKDKVSGKSQGPLQRMWSRSHDTESHIFTGTKPVSIDGRTWQLCDLRDPTMEKLVNVPELYLRSECEQRYFGWYANGTSAKMRVMLKAKIDALAAGEQLDPAMIASFMELPEAWDPKTKPVGVSETMTGYLTDGVSKKALEWASAYRSLCRTAVGEIPAYGAMGKGRLSKSKPKTRPSYIDTQRTSSGGMKDTEVIEPDIEDDEEVAEGYGEPEDVENDFFGNEDIDEDTEL